MSGRATIRHKMSRDGLTCERRALQRRPIGRGVAIVAAAACLVSGCGGVPARGNHTAEAHDLTLARAICREYDASIDAGQQGRVGAGSDAFLAQREAELASLRAVMSSASALSDVDNYISDLAADERLLTGLRREAGKGYAAYLHVALSKAYREESRKLDAKVVADEKVLGLTACTGPARPPIAG
jgi:hypothetical protein